jgi:hypothetical protein
LTSYRDSAIPIPPRREIRGLNFRSMFFRNFMGLYELGVFLSFIVLFKDSLKENYGFFIRIFKKL